jgi:DNA polymerase-3 subunit delta'
LISGPTGAGKKTLARLLAAAAMCTGREKPCLQCPHCRKVMAGTHPDFITVDDPEKRYVPIDLVRAATADMYVQPNEADRKIYLFPRAQDMQVPSQNALLKILEEPPAYGVFILLTDNAQMMLPTIRSRCTELKLQPLAPELLGKALSQRFPQASREELAAAAERSGGYLGQAAALLESGCAIAPQTESFARAFALRNSLELVQTLAPMEKWKRDALLEILQSWLELVEGALAQRSGVAAVSPLSRQLSASRSGPELYRAAQELKKAMEYTSANVSTGAVCAYLAWALR